MRKLRILLEAPKEIVIFVFNSFISCLSYLHFIFYVIDFFITYLIPTNLPILTIKGGKKILFLWQFSISFHIFYSEIVQVKTFDWVKSGRLWALELLTWEFFLLWFYFSFYFIHPFSGAQNMLTVPSYRSVRHPLKGVCPGYDTKLHLMARLLFWISRNCGVFLHCHYSQVHPDHTCYDPI